MKPYQDKKTGLWKWGTRGKAIYESKEICAKAGLDIMLNRLKEVRDKVNGVIQNHGK